MLGEMDLFGSAGGAVAGGDYHEPRPRARVWITTTVPQHPRPVKPLDLGFVSDAWLREHTWRAGRGNAG